MRIPRVTKTLSELAPEFAAAFQVGKSHFGKGMEALKDLPVNVLAQGLVGHANGILDSFGVRRAMGDDSDAVSAQQRGAADFKGIEGRTQGRQGATQQHKSQLALPIGREQTA